MGFFTKFGDGAADILPLSGLNKRRVRALAVYLGAPSDLVEKIPTADLENLVPVSHTMRLTTSSKAKRSTKRRTGVYFMRIPAQPISERFPSQRLP